MVRPESDMMNVFLNSKPPFLIAELETTHVCTYDKLNVDNFGNTYTVKTKF